MNIIIALAALGLSFAVVGCSPRTPVKPGTTRTDPNVPDPNQRAPMVVTNPMGLPFGPEVVKQPPPPKQYDGPFGLAMGIPEKELTDQYALTREDGSQFGTLGKPPRPADGYTRYMATAAPEVGLCKIGAYKDFPIVNGSGDQLKAEVESVKEILLSKYGKPSDNYTRISQSLYKRAPDLWMMGLQKDSVNYAYGWKNGKGDLNLPYDIQDIIVSASAYSSTSGFVSVLYEFKNLEQCQAMAKKAKAANF